MLTIPSRVIAACFALGGFAAAVIVGAVAGNPAETVLVRALLVMAVCWLIGHLVSYLASRAIAEHLETYRQEHPIPEETDAVGAEAGASGAEASDADATGGEAESAGAGAPSEPGVASASRSTAAARSSSPGAGAGAQAVSPT